MRAISINRKQVSKASRIPLLALLLITVILSPSCKKYLDITPTGMVMPQTLKDYRAVLTEAYNTEMNDRSIASFRSDELQLDESDPENVEFVANPFIWNENGTEFRSVIHNWRGQYKIIFYTNVVLKDGANATEGSKTEIDQLLGEAYLLRAYTNFNLVNIYGPAYNAATAATDKAVPLVTAVDLEQVAQRNTVQEIYTQVLSDIAAGKKLLNKESYESKYSYRFTSVAADALEARVYLYMKNYQASLDAAKRVLAKRSALVDLNQAGALIPNDYTSVENILALEKLFPGSLSNTTRVSETLKALYGITDLRLTAYYNTATPMSVKKISNDKYRTSFRTSELYLIAAEASAALKNPADAKNYLNTLKKARFTPAGYATEESKVNQLSDQGLVTEIADERARELAFEGHRWFDLRRTTQPRIAHQMKGKEYVLNAGDARYTISIPRDAILNNGLLLK
ncbi:MAG: RagB/SusD family nutrient uptake outer membrane protein [Chitinophagaceae bacterium]|nr:RagB/SusD family nutrient uptake outer membrane protein [Chitinophagaceae bacterium]